MVFSSAIFIFLFLPLVLLLYFLPAVRPKWQSRSGWKNGVLILSSLLFYIWGEGIYVLAMLGCITFNWAAALLLIRYPQQRTLVLKLGVAGNLAFLGYYKYAGFIFGNLIAPLPGGETLRPLLTGIHMPIGISFFTFQAMSYLIDVYRGDVKVERSWIKLCLFKSFFPQLIAGPIVRYRDIAAELNCRRHTLDDFSCGVRRLIIGFAQKVILANTFGAIADRLFNAPVNQLSPALAWTAAIAYSFQIYFDFCGYSNMAIGIARMFGFHFLENFNYPYSAQSITDFWRRWHISLSSWFRDYLYIPLGGSRHGPAFTYRNLVIVFLLCGLWHGAEWHFVAWGLFHGLFLVLERGGLAQLLLRLPRVLRHLYSLLVVLIGWVLFRADTFEQAAQLLGLMFGAGAAGDGILFREIVSPEAALFAVLAAVSSTPLLESWISAVGRRKTAAADSEPPLLWLCAHLFLFFLALSYLAAGSFNPFIYFRF